MNQQFFYRARGPPGDRRSRPVPPRPVPSRPVPSRPGAASVHCLDSCAGNSGLRRLRRDSAGSSGSEAPGRLEPSVTAPEYPATYTCAPPPPSPLLLVVVAASQRGGLRYISARRYDSSERSGWERSGAGGQPVRRPAPPPRGGLMRPFKCIMARRSDTDRRRRIPFESCRLPASAAPRIPNGVRLDSGGCRAAPTAVPYTVPDCLSVRHPLIR